MSTEIPQAKRLQAVRLYFEGLPYDEIASKTGMAKGSVAAIVEDLREGRVPQFEHLSELLNELRDIAVQLRKIGMSVTEASLLFTMTRRLIALGVEPPLLERWVRMCQSVGQDDLPRSQIIQAATELAKLEGDGLSYEEAIANLTNASAQMRELEEKLAKLRTEEGQMEERSQELLRANRNLEAQNVKLQRSLDAMTVNVKEGEGHCQGLSKQIRQRQEAVNRLERRERELTEKDNKFEEKAQTLRKQVDDTTKVLRDLDDLGFSRNDLERLRATLKEMAERHGNKELTVRFYGYLANYDSLLGLEMTRETLAKEVNTLTEQKDSLALLGEKLMLTSHEVAEGIAALKSLRKKGISPRAIASYQRVLKGAGTEPRSFERLLIEFGGLEQMLTARRSELERRQHELEAKTQAVEVLKGEEAGVKGSIATLRESAVKEINGTATLAAAEVKQFCHGLHQDINRWGDIRAEMGKCQDELKIARYFSVLPLSEKMLSSLVEEIGFPVVTQYLIIALSWCRKKLNPKLRPSKAILRKYYSIGEYTEVELADIIAWALLMFVEGMGNDQGRA